MKKRRNSKGFTLAEMLIVVAITVILMGVAFISVQYYQRSMTRLEFDGIAKEIFVAAQNHLTSAEGQGYLQNTNFGTKGTYEDDEKDGVYLALKSDEILELILPFASVDETVRAGGTYIIRYQPSSGTVLDVFYSLPGKSSMLTVAGVGLAAEDYLTLMGGFTGEGNKARENYSANGKKGVVGWYGGADTLPVGTRLQTPEIIIHNEEILWVEIKDKNTLSSNGPSLKLTVKDNVSNTQLAFDLSSLADDRVQSLTDEDEYHRYAVILDDITTAGMLFSDLKDINGKSFIPGENVSVEAVALNNSALTNVAYSGKKTTNSLFADIDASEGDGKTVYTALADNFRHFENLDKSRSSFDEQKAVKDSEGNEVTVSAAKQLIDMNWGGDISDKSDEAPKGFLDQIHALRKQLYGSDPDSVIIYKDGNTAVTTKADTLYPVSPDFALAYEGGNHVNYNVKVDHSGATGLFGSLADSSKVENLKLIDFDITGTASAGALVGTATGTTISNVVAYNSENNDSKYDNDDTTTDKKPNVTATGAAGGLIGSMTGGKVEKSAAAVYVKGGTDAGGLIGAATNGASVTASYSGGHTYSGVPTGAEQKYDDAHKSVYPVRYYDKDNKPLYNVIASGGTAGGLIGTAGDTTISGSYSTCSASGTTTGGFVGTSTGSISNSYCTGLVMEPGDSVANHGAFAGTADMSKLSNCQFFEIINEIKRDEGNNEISGYDYLRPLGNVKKSETVGVAAFDASADSYNSFVGGQSSWAEAKAAPYDMGGTETYGLKAFYKVDGKSCYIFPTVEKLNELGTAENKIDIEEDDFVKAPYAHYGDWPAPEEFIFN